MSGVGPTLLSDLASEVYLLIARLLPTRWPRSRKWAKAAARKLMYVQQGGSILPWRKP